MEENTVNRVIAIHNCIVSIDRENKKIILDLNNACKILGRLDKIKTEKINRLLEGLIDQRYNMFSKIPIRGFSLQYNEVMPETEKD